MAGQDESDAVAQFVENFASTLIESGVPRMPARVFACLMAADDGRLTAAELAERLRASPAAISGAVRYLVQVQLISRGREPGSRRDHFVIAHEAIYRVTASRDRELARWIDQLDRGVAVLGPGTVRASRAEETRDFLQFLMKEMGGLIERWEEHRRGLAAPDS